LSQIDLNDLKNVTPHEIKHINILDEDNMSVAIMSTKGKNKSFPNMQVDVLDPNVRYNSQSGTQFVTTTQMRRQYDESILQNDDLVY